MRGGEQFQANNGGLGPHGLIHVGQFGNAIASPVARERHQRCTLFPMTALGARTRDSWLGGFLCAAAVACLIAWGWSLNRLAWDPASDATRWPRYLGVHHGRLVVMSTLWRKGHTGTYAWASRGWIYDTLGGPRSLWAIDYRRIGDSYGGTPPHKAVIDALFVPIWYFAAPLAWAGILRLRKARRAHRQGLCAACGYPLGGLADGAACPECGKSTARNDEAVIRADP